AADTGADGGSAYRYNVFTGELVTSYTSIAGPNAKFGSSICALAHNQVLIGASRSSVGGLFAGAAFRQDADSGSIGDVFAQNPPSYLNAFGSSLAAAKKNFWVVARYLNYTNNTYNYVPPDRGAVYAYDKDGLAIGWSANASAVAAYGSAAVVGVNYTPVPSY